MSRGSFQENRSCKHCAELEERVAEIKAKSLARVSKLNKINGELAAKVANLKLVQAESAMATELKGSATANLVARLIEGCRVLGERIAEADRKVFEIKSQARKGISRLSAAKAELTAEVVNLKEAAEQKDTGEPAKRRRAEPTTPAGGTPDGAEAGGPFPPTAVSATEKLACRIQEDCAGLTSAIALACRSSQVGRKRVGGMSSPGSRPEKKRRKTVTWADALEHVRHIDTREDANGPAGPPSRVDRWPETIQVGVNTVNVKDHLHVVKAIEALLIKHKPGAADHLRMKDVHDGLSEWTLKHYGRGILQGVPRSLLVGCFGVDVTPQVNYCNACKGPAPTETCSEKCPKRTKCHLVVNLSFRVA